MGLTSGCRTEEEQRHQAMCRLQGNNQQAHSSRQHPIPNPNQLLSRVTGGNVSSTLDLSQAYAQLPLSEASQKYCVIATHRGLYAFQRLPFGPWTKSCKVFRAWYAFLMMTWSRVLSRRSMMLAFARFLYA